jgi:hypothetical protein
MSDALPDRVPPSRGALLLSGMAALVIGVLAGLTRAGWHAPLPRPELAALHGPLMVTGFLGIVIGLERAVGLGRPWGYAAPVLSAAGAVALLAGAPVPVAAGLATAGALILTVILLHVAWTAPALHHTVLAFAAAFQVVGNFLWTVGEIPATVAPWWLAFLVLTIAGERLELTRLAPSSPLRRGLFVLAIAGLAAGVALSGQAVGPWLQGWSLVALALWLGAFDVARRTVRMPGLTRYIAVCLLAGYVWLAIGGLLLALAPPQLAGPWHDAQLHAVFLGFVFSMILGHAPVIFPAVLRVPVPFRRVFYAHLVLLHGSVAARVLGDVLGFGELRRQASLVNALALLLFFVATALAVLGGLRQRRLGGA